ncbi:hypothetical protein AB5J72_49530 [Streptomyces sp. CG1]|uniref:hypothetical protein n=1 Tax=Streptomyces sp. CG1 TaxID=1287523 RepID=UPI0034E28CA8
MIREVVRGSVVTEFYEASAVVSRKCKQDPGRPSATLVDHRAGRPRYLRRRRTVRPPRTRLRRPRPARQHDPRQQLRARVSRKLIEKFIEHVNEHTDRTGLDEIPEGRVAPHMFRKTMSMLVGTEPGAEIALGLQLKHAATRALANRSTQGYAASDENWARLLDTAVEDARFMRLRDLYDQHHAGRTIGYGSGADRLTPPTVVTICDGLLVSDTSAATSTAVTRSCTPPWAGSASAAQPTLRAQDGLMAAAAGRR